MENYLGLIFVENNLLLHFICELWSYLDLPSLWGWFL